MGNKQFRRPASARALVGHGQEDDDVRRAYMHGATFGLSAWLCLIIAMTSANVGKLDTHDTKSMAGDIGPILKACRTPVVGPHQTKKRTRCAEKPSPSFRTSPRPKTSSGAPLPRQSAFWQAPASGLRRRELPQPEQELRSPLSSIRFKHPLQE